VVPLGQLALSECRTLNEIHNVPTISARKPQGRRGARTASVHDPGYVSLRTAFTSDDGGLLIIRLEPA
jgi:hypothetical protein